MSDGTEYALDMLVLATGYDAITGGITQIDIRGTDGVLIRDKWEIKGLLTYLSLVTANCPNMFFPFSPQAPTCVGNGPGVIVRLPFLPTPSLRFISLSQELQGAWIVDFPQQTILLASNRHAKSR